MSIAVFLKVILFIFAGVSLLVAFRSLLIGMRSKNAANKQFFNVGRLEAQRKVFSSMLSTVGLVVLALCFLTGALFIPDDFLSGWFAPEEALVEEAAAEDVPVENGGSVANGGDADGAGAEPTTAGEAASPEAVPTVTLTPIPTEAPVPTPAQTYVYVDSPIVGLYIRDLPDGDIMEVLDHQARLSLGGESTIVNEISWILVMTDEEREGWVAEQFTSKIPPSEEPPVSEELDSQDTTEEEQDG